MSRTFFSTRSIFLSALLAGSVISAQAQDVGQHPAVFAPRQLPGVDPSTFIVGHPASPMWDVGRANHDHPAGTAKRHWASRPIDPNTFLVQPPASAQWMDPLGAGLSVAASSVETSDS